jgi:hypothetical protein
VVADGGILSLSFVSSQ